MIVTLTTDFGLASAYVAQMKGVLLAAAPHVTLVDGTHGISPQNIRQGARALRDLARTFPPGTLHVAVIDPGVGTARRIVYAELGGQRFLTPDNGLLTLVVRGTRLERAIEVSEPRYWRQPVSFTFHGRDIFAPVAAALCGGLDPLLLGPARDELAMLAWPRPSRRGPELHGEVIDRDTFGNLITNIEAPQLAALLASDPSAGLEVTLSARTITGVLRTYGEAKPGDLIALVGSSDELEVAIVGGDAAQALGASVGDAVVCRLVGAGAVGD